MKKIIDLQTFQKLTTDCMRVHETVRSTEPLTAEAERILQLADTLLREAGLAYLNEGQNLDLPSLPNSEQATPPKQVVENFIGVQHALATLKQALYQLVKTYVTEQRWPELATWSNALTCLGENGSDFSSIVEAIEATIPDTLIPQAEDLFKSKEWDRGRKLLKSCLFSPKIRSCYYTSYVDQSYTLKNNHPLIELKSQLPAESRTSLIDEYIHDNDTVHEFAYPHILTEVNEIVMDPHFNPNQVL